MIILNGENPYRNGRNDLEKLSGEQVIVELINGTELQEKLAGYWGSSFDLLEAEAVRPRSLFYPEVRSVRHVSE